MGESQGTHQLTRSSFLGKMQEHSEAKEKWQDQLQCFRHSNGHKELFGIDGEPLSLSGILSQDVQHSRFSKRFRTEWQFVKHVQKNLKIESSSCLCSPTSIGLRKLQCMFFEFCNGQEPREKISDWTLVFSRSRRRRKMVWNARLQT